MTDNFVEHYELECVQEQIWELQRKVDELQMENTLLRNDLNTIKNEGCWRFVENKTHPHRGDDE